VITQPEGRERVIVIASPSSHMPLEIRVEAHSATGWVPGLLIRPAFDQPIDSSLFAHQFPRGVRVVDQEEESRQWRAQLERPVHLMKSGGHVVAIRNVTVNPLGHVFVLFTDGYARKDEIASANETLRLENGDRSAPVTIFHANFKITDSLGTEYLQSGSSLQPHMGSIRDDWTQGLMMSDGQILEGAWFIPVKDLPWSPRKLSLRLDSSADSWGVKFDRPNSGVLPDWAPQMAIGPRDAGDVLSAARVTRRPEMKYQGDWKGVEASLRADLADAAERERSEGETIAQGTTYFELYEALKHNGKGTEALEFLKLASREAMYPHQYPADEIAAALRKEGL